MSYQAFVVVSPGRSPFELPLPRPCRLAYCVIAPGPPLTVTLWVQPVGNPRDVTRRRFVVQGVGSHELRLRELYPQT